jgi:predicted DNA-binding protein (UPF0251 family)
MLIIMSPRPIRLRKISNPAIISGFRPYGNNKSGKNPEIVFLCLEEYEALRLCDFNRLNHYQASQTMDISRPTLTRIYARARQKIAEAIVHGKQIIIKSSNVYFDSDWYLCKSCGCYFSYPDKQEKIKECPMCKSPDIISYERLPDTQGLPFPGL